jgi:hypothetical protein
MGPIACGGNAVFLLRKTAFLCRFDDPVRPSASSGRDQFSPKQKGEAMSSLVAKRLSACFP